MIDTFEHGKLPPQAIDLEEAVLGALMLEKHTLTEVMDKLVAANFYKEVHQKIFQAISDLDSNSEPTDYLTVINQLKRNGDLEVVGGPYYITQLTGRTASTANTSFHAHIILQKFIQREIIRISSGLIEEAFDDTIDVFDLVDKSQQLLNDVVLANMRTSEVASAKLFGEFHEHMEKAAKLHDDGKLSGVPSILNDLDRVTGGWQPGHMVTVASRPAMGKTAFTKALIKGVVVIEKEPVVMFSLEMPRVELIARLISEDIDVSMQNIMSGKALDQMNEIHDAETKFFDDNKELLVIDDTPGLSIRDLTTRAKRIMAIHRPKLGIIDYLQLMKGSNPRQSREQEISEISRGIKALAKATGIPWIALSQLNREVDKRNPPRPKLADLRESGSIEQDSDEVLFLYREWYYYKDQKNDKYAETTVRGEVVSTENVCEIIIAKNRNGATKNIAVQFTPEFTKFEDWPNEFQQNKEVTPKGTAEGTTTGVEEENDDLPF